MQMAVVVLRRRWSGDGNRGGAGRGVLRAAAKAAVAVVKLLVRER